MKVVDSSNIDIALALTQIKKLKWDGASLTTDALCNLFSHNYDVLFGQFGHSHKSSKRLKPLIQNLLNGLKTDSLEEKAHSLTLFINQFLASPIFPKGNHFILRQSLVMLTEHLKETGVINTTLDFRATDLATLSNPQELESWILKSLICQAEEQDYYCEGDDFPALPDSSITVLDYKFLTYDSFIVAQNGGLIEAEYVIPDLERHIEHYGTARGFTIHKSSINSYLFNDDSPLSELDGIAFTDEIPLVCLSLDYLTGLHMHNELPILADYLRHHNISILDLTEQHHLAIANWEEVIARIKKLAMYVQIICNNLTKDLIPSQDPTLFLSQGGIGSGKSSLLKYAKNRVDSPMLTASADSARATSRFFQFYLKCNHHSDDYNTLTLYSSVIIGELTKRALANKYNYFRDATGIPYKERYEQLITIFRDNGFRTIVLSASAPLIVEKDRKDMDSSVFKRIMKRLKKKKRAIPWNVVISKHVNHPKSFIDAVFDTKNELVLLFDTMMKKGHTKLLAFTIKTNSQQLAHLNNAATISHFYLKEELMKSIQCEQITNHLQLAESSHFKLLYNHDVDPTVLVILDQVKFLDFLQKTSFNQSALCFAQLKYNKFPAHMPDADYPFFQRKEITNYRLRQQILGYND